MSLAQREIDVLRTVWTREAFHAGQQDILRRLREPSEDVKDAIGPLTAQALPYAADAIEREIKGE